MIKYKDIEKKAMPPEKREQCKDDWFSFYIGRKLTYWMTIPFLYTKLSPNNITFISILMLILGFAVNCCATTKWLMIIAWLCYFLWSLFDGVDGNVARYRSQFSKMGDIYDTMGGYAAYALIFLGMGVGAWLQPGYIVFIPKTYYIIIGAISSIASIFPRLVYQKIKATFKNDESMDRVRKETSLIRKIEMNVTSIAGGIMIFSFVSIVFNLLDIFTVIYCFLNVMKMLLSLYSIFRDMESET